MKIKMKMKNRSHRYDINRPTPRYAQKYRKYKKCLSMMMLRCLAQFIKKLSNTEPGLKQKQCL